MPSTRRRKPSTTSHLRPEQTATLAQYAQADGYTLRTIGDTPAACMETTTDGQLQVVLAIVELPGCNRWGNKAFGMVRRWSDDRWSPSDADGALEHEFPTLHAAIAALTDPARRKAMREYTNLVQKMQEINRAVRDFPPVEGALPNYWQTKT